MAYSAFTIEQIKEDFDLEIREDFGFYERTKSVKVRKSLQDTVKENLPLALAIGTEKAKSEMLVAPMLVELRKLRNHEISLFSGVDFNVDSSRGLNGVCDFLLSASPFQYSIDAPVVALVEAKDDDLKDRLPQCLAEMIAAQLFNERKHNAISILYGVVTTGSKWNFIRMEEKTAWVDSKEYAIENPHKIMGILLSMVSGT